jgi:hypothetical protein
MTYVLAAMVGTPTISEFARSLDENFGPARGAHRSPTAGPRLARPSSALLAAGGPDTFDPQKKDGDCRG